jgi:hypothetical protein
MWTYYCVWACVWVQTAEIFRVHYYFFALMCLRFCIAFWWSTQPTRIAHTNREAPLREPNAPSEPNRAELVCTWFNPCCPKSLTPHCSRFGSVAAPETRCAERQTRLRPAGKSNTIFVAFAGKMQFDLYVQLRPSYLDAARARKSHTAARPFQCLWKWVSNFLDVSGYRFSDRVPKTIFQSAK